MSKIQNGPHFAARDALSCERPITTVQRVRKSLISLGMPKRTSITDF